MSSNRTIQTILQAVMVVLVAAIVFKLPTLTSPGGGAKDAHHSAPGQPTENEIKMRYRQYFNDDEEASTKAELLGVSVDDVSVEGLLATVKLKIELKWTGHNVGYTEGPLKNAPGKRGDTTTYAEVFKFRRWTKKWDIEGRRDRPIIQ